MTNPASRIIDANSNRAREALRVMEEYARFVLDDAALTEATKALRHELADTVKGFSHDLTASRDTAGDVGTGITSPAEAQRADARDVVTAAAKRLTEALRAIEEYGKTLHAESAAAMEQLRYRAYELEKRFDRRLRPAGAWDAVRLYVLITESLCSNDWLATASAALDGGADCLQLREKGLDDAELLDRARKLADLCHQRGALCIVNNRPDIAVLSSADGVHLGQDDLPVSAARRIVGPDRIIGRSTHTMEQASAALTQSPDYIAVGPMFESGTKPQSHVAGPATFAEVRRLTSLPLVAIGGIDGDNLDALLAVGCRCICVCHSVIAQSDPRQAATLLRERMP